jgi:hypothetical protein
MPAAKTRTRYTFLTAVEFARETGAEYAVEEHTGSTTRTIGRVYGASNHWLALGVGMPAWTAPHRTRKDAVQAMRQGRTFEVDQLAS